MTKKQLYTCDICHTDYANKEDSLKKVMNKRITEMELSNSRYINKSEVN